MDQISINTLKQPLLSEESHQLNRSERFTRFYSIQQYELQVQPRESKLKPIDQQEQSSISSGSSGTQISIRSVLSISSPEPQILNEQSSIILRRDRLQEIKNYKYLQSRPQRKAQIEIDITQILIREMQDNSKVFALMEISIFLDFLVRINSLIFLIYLLKEHSKFYITLGVITVLPRILNYMSKLKLLTIELYKKKNYSILKIAILYQQNFSDEDLDYISKLEWYDWKKSQILKYFIWRFIFVLLPMELSIIPLFFVSRIPDRPSIEFNKKNAALTYISEGFILNTIEILTFVPFFALIVTYDVDVNNELGNPFTIFTLILQYFECGKYFLIVFIFLTKRNYQLNFLRREDKSR